MRLCQLLADRKEPEPWTNWPIGPFRLRVWMRMGSYGTRLLAAEYSRRVFQKK